MNSKSLMSHAIISCIHVNTAKLCNITCTSVATCVILRSFRVYLGVLYTMDQEVIPRPYKILSLVVELVMGPLRFTPRGKSHSDHGARGIQNTYFKA